MSSGKKFSMLSLMATVITVVLVVEAAAPVAAIGNQQFFWWILLTFTFLLPYGLIASELGTTYQSEGGMCDWAHMALGRRMAGRTAWYYWINFPIWMASLAIMSPLLLQFVFGFEFPLIPTMLVQLAFIWLVVFMGKSKAADNIVLFNVVAVIKVLLVLAIGGLGVYIGVTQGFATELTAESLFPQSLDSISTLALVLFNFLGFEVICTFADQMEDPKKQIPKAVVLGGLLIALLYMFSSLGIGAAIPADEIASDTGVVDAFVAMLGASGGPMIAIVALAFLFTLFGNMISWSMGVNNVVAYAADEGLMPKVFAKRDQQGLPVGANLVNGVFASVIVIIAPFIPSQDLFWSFFSLNLFSFIVSYLPMFPSFLKLRKIDGDRPRPYRVPGGKALLNIVAWLPFVQIILCAIFVVLPMDFSPEGLAAVLPTTIGALLIVVINEVYLRVKGVTNERCEIKTE